MDFFSIYSDRNPRRISNLTQFGVSELPIKESRVKYCPIDQMYAPRPDINPQILINGVFIPRYNQIINQFIEQLAGVNELKRTKLNDYLEVTLRKSSRTNSLRADFNDSSVVGLEDLQNAGLSERSIQIIENLGSDISMCKRYRFTIDENRVTSAKMTIVVNLNDYVKIIDAVAKFDQDEADSIAEYARFRLYVPQQYLFQTVIKIRKLYPEFVEAAQIVKGGRQGLIDIPLIIYIELLSKLIQDNEQRLLGEIQYANIKSERALNRPIEIASNPLTHFQNEIKRLASQIADYQE